jgi:CheY-like chemotaxis protein
LNLVRVTMPTPRRELTVLIADDDQNDVFILKRLLAKAGIDAPLRIFGDGEEVLAHLRALLPAPPAASTCLLLLDLKMPKVNGFEVLRWIRSQEAFRSMPVVILSGSEEPRDLQRARELGATRYLIKHPPPEVFASLLGGLAP